MTAPNARSGDRAAAVVEEIARGGGRAVAFGADVTSPAGVTELTSSQELGVHGITVNVVSPGWVPVERHDGLSSEELERYAAGVPLRRLGVPREIASAVARLASADASYVNGENLTVNGGRTA